jgi:hypothetical protein
MTPSIGLDVIDRLTGGRLGVFDVMCPRRGPFRRSARNQRRQVLRVWKIEPSFATFCCARCGVHGHVLYRDGKRPDAAKFAKARADAAEHDRIHKANRLSLARWFWQRRKPLKGSIAEVYLREARHIRLDRWPATLGFLPALGGYPCAMIAAFGLAHEIEPGVIAIDDAAMHGMHLTRLLLSKP